MGAGISFGCAEATSNIIAGFILKYFKDKHALMGCFGLSLICQLVFFFAGANEGGIVAFTALFVNMLGIGGAFIVIYFMVDQRISSDKSASAMVIVITVSFVYASLGPYIAYASQPIPFFTGICTLVVAALVTLLLPDKN